MLVNKSDLPELDERQYRICFDESDYQLQQGRFLQVGKGLAVTQVLDRDGSRFAYLVGHWIDIPNAVMGNSEITFDVVATQSVDELATAILDRLGGQFVLILFPNNDLRDSDPGTNSFSDRPSIGLSGLFGACVVERAELSRSI